MARLMRSYKLDHVGDAALLTALSALVTRDRVTTARLLAHIAEVDARRLYLPAGYPSMFAYCVEGLHLSEDATFKRIQVARTAREFPAVFAALADGRLHCTAVRLLAPHLSAANADELIAAATHRTRPEVELWLARRFPRAEALRLDDGVSALPRQPAPGQVAGPGPAPCPGLAPRLEPAPCPEPAPGQVPTRIAPSAPERYSLQVTISQATHDKLRYAQSLLGHSLPSGDVALVLDRALDSLIGDLEKRNFAVTAKPRPHPRPALPARGARTIPAHVRRAVWERDRGQCTFVGNAGRPCGERMRLEFDHADPVARGGSSMAENIRLRCRAHNQFEAERAFGAEFMQGKRASSALTEDVIAGLRGLGLGANEARRVAIAATGDTVEARLRNALRMLRPRGTTVEHGRVTSNIPPALIAGFGPAVATASPSTTARGPTP